MMLLIAFLLILLVVCVAYKLVCGFMSTIDIVDENIAKKKQIANQIKRNNSGGDE